MLQDKDANKSERVMEALFQMKKIDIQGLRTAGPNGEMYWMVWNWDEELKNYVFELTEPVDTIILGR
jgi:hypothetical protein